MGVHRAAHEDGGLRILGLRFQPGYDLAGAKTHIVDLDAGILCKLIKHFKRFVFHIAGIDRDGVDLRNFCECRQQAQNHHQ